MIETKRKCTNPSCSTRGLVVTTELTAFIACGADLAPHRWVDQVLGDVLGQILRGGGR